MRKRMRPAKDVDSYLASVPDEARPALQKIRKTIKSVAPKATEKISYGMPMMYLDGPLVAFATFEDHSSFFPMSVRVMEAHKNELRPYSQGKGTIRFPVGKPLPAALVRSMVKARIKENRAKAEARAKRKLENQKMRKGR